MDILFSQDQLEIDGYLVHIAFTSVEAGNLGLHVGEDGCGVLKNRANLESRLGLESGAFAYLNQVHGTALYQASLAEISAPEISIQYARKLQESAPVADAALARDGRPLAIMVADCIPLVFVGRRPGQRPLLAVAHAGRRGLLDGVIQETVAQLEAQGASQIFSWLGPSICGNCYEVPEAMQRESEQLAPGIASQTSWGTPALDLPARAQAILEGLPSVCQVSRSLSTCTLENPAVFSHRRGDAGRIAGLVWEGK